MAKSAEDRSDGSDWLSELNRWQVAEWADVLSVI